MYNSFSMEAWDFDTNWDLSDGHQLSFQDSMLNGSFMPPSVSAVDASKPNALDMHAQFYATHSYRKHHAEVPTGTNLASAMMENHWEQAHGQAHIEQWLDQKVNEECSAQRDQELEVHQQIQAEGPDDQLTASPQRRRVKFDFSSLIDG